MTVLTKLCNPTAIMDPTVAPTMKATLPSPLLLPPVPPNMASHTLKPPQPLIDSPIALSFCGIDTSTMAEKTASEQG